MDCGIGIRCVAVYLELRQRLIEQHNYKPLRENPLRLYTPTGTIVDLLPFGSMGLENAVLLDGMGLADLQLDGFKEAHRFGLLEVEIEGDRVLTCSIPGVVLLKLIAYDDRPEYRLKDPIDINTILLSYPDFERNLIWEKYHDLYQDEKSHQAVGLEVLGREIDQLLRNSPELKVRIVDILNRAIRQESDLAVLMIADALHETIASKVQMLIHLRQGLTPTT